MNLKCLGISLCLATFVNSIPSAYCKTSGSIVVGPDNVKLSYVDSGPPKLARYTTAFVVHGLSFNNGIFNKIQALGPVTNSRIVAINRRDYHGSTPYSSTELDVIANGTDAQRTAFMIERGVELATFIDQFMQNSQLPLPVKKGDTGSVALISWSAGIMASLAALANIKMLDPAVQQRLATRMQTFIVHEPSVETFGLPSFPSNYIPLIDNSVPASTQGILTAQFLTNYFQHGNLSARDPNLLTWVVPSIIHPPTIYNLSFEEFDSIVELGPSANDFAMIFNFGPQLNSNYRAAFFDPVTRSSLPKMKILSFIGTLSPAFAPYGQFIMQDDNDSAGGQFMNFSMVDGINHFVHWDNPAKAIAVYLSLIQE